MNHHGYIHYLSLICGVGLSLPEFLDHPSQWADLFETLTKRFGRLCYIINKTRTQGLPGIKFQAYLFLNVLRPRFLVSEIVSEIEHLDTVTESLFDKPVVRDERRGVFPVIGVIDN